MKNRQGKVLTFNGWQDVPYPTYGKKVYLGPHPTKKLKSNAKAAGLQPITKRQLTGIFRNQNILYRIVQEGRWYNTVKY